MYSKLSLMNGLKRVIQSFILDRGQLEDVYGLGNRSKFITIVSEKSGSRSPGKGGVASAFRYHGCRYHTGTAAPWSSTGVVKISF